MKKGTQMTKHFLRLIVNVFIRIIPNLLVTRAIIFIKQKVLREIEVIFFKINFVI